VTFQPVIISYGGERSSTPADELAASVISLAGMLSYERVTGRYTNVEPVVVIDSDDPIWIPEDGKVSENTGIWAQVAMTLGEHYDLSSHEKTFGVWVLHTPWDASGVGQPLFDEAKGWVLWDDRADPDLSGLFVMGERPLVRLYGVSHSRGYYSRGDRSLIDMSRWLWMHEAGHSWGRHHTGMDAANPNGKPRDAGHVRNSWMAYGSHYFVNGDMKSIGAYRDEITTWRLSRMLNKGQTLTAGERILQSDLAENKTPTISRADVRGTDYLRMYFPDRAAALSRDIPVKIVMGQGLLPGDYV